MELVKQVEVNIDYILMLVANIMNLIVQIIECSKKYMQKFRKLDEKYNVNQNNK